MVAVWCWPSHWTCLALALAWPWTCAEVLGLGLPHCGLGLVTCGLVNISAIKCFVLFSYTDENVKSLLAPPRKTATYQVRFNYCSYFKIDVI